MLRPPPAGLNVQSQSGLTIIEIVAATVIIAILASGVLSSMSVAYVADRNSTDSITAQNLVREVVESVEATPFEAMLALDGSTLVDDRFMATTTTTLVSVGLMRVEVVVTCSDNPEVNAVAITLIADRD